jgi:hypothetical protein
MTHDGMLLADRVKCCTRSSLGIDQAHTSFIDHTGRPMPTLEAKKEK